MYVYMYVCFVAEESPGWASRQWFFALKEHDRRQLDQEHPSRWYSAPWTAGILDVTTKIGRPPSSTPLEEGKSMTTFLKPMGSGVSHINTRAIQD